jgi:uncharacterized membrane protein YedE/YeeE
MTESKSAKWNPWHAALYGVIVVVAIEVVHYLRFGGKSIVSELLSMYRAEGFQVTMGYLFGRFLVAGIIIAAFVLVTLIHNERITKKE